MAKYKYSALKNNNNIINGEIEASNPREAREKIRELGFLPTKIYLEQSNEINQNVDFDVDTKNVQINVSRLSLQEKIMFTSELEVLLSSGIPIIEALQSIANNTPKQKIKTVCEKIKDGILSGMTFAQALESFYGKVFGPVYTGLVKTGENAGELDVTLSRMLLLLRKQDRIKGQIINASIYPAILIIIMFGLLVLFSKVVFPAFMGVFAFNGAELPFLASMLVGICSFVEHFWWLIIIAIGAVCGAASSLFKNYQFKSKWDEFILNVPIVSDFIKYINLSNFLTVLHISYDAGLPIMSGLELSNGTVGNYSIKRKINKSLSMVRNGKSLTESFQCTDAIPHALLTMIATGEKSGTLGKMFHDAAEVIDKKVDMALEAMTKMFEPLLIVILGGVILFVAIAFYQMYIGMLGTLF